MQNAETPNLDIILWLDAQLEAAIQAGGCEQQVAASVENAISDLLRELGLPAQARVAVRAGLPDDHQAALLALQVNGHTLPSSPGLENRLLAVLHDRLLRPGENGPAIPGWLQGAFQGAQADNRQAALRYLGMLCSAILGEQTGLLIDEAQTYHLQAGWSQIAGEISSLEPAWLTAVLRELLAMRLSLRDHAILLPVLLENYPNNPQETAESAIAALLPTTAGICVPRHLLRDYTLEDYRLPASPSDPSLPDTPTSQTTSAFFQLGRQFFADTGINLPLLEFEVDDSPARSFAFRINGLRTPPYPALPPGIVLVDATPETLEMMNIRAQAVLHPLDGRLCSLVSLGDETPPSENGYFTWNGIEYLALCLGNALRSQPGCLVHNLSVSKLLEEVARSDAELVKAVTGTPPSGNTGYTQAGLTRTLRYLVQQGISMQELPQILQALLLPAVVEVPSPDWVVTGNAMPTSAGLAQSNWQSDPAILAAYARWQLAQPAIPIRSGDYAYDPARLSKTGLEQYAEPLTLSERLVELSKFYSNEDIQHYLSFMAVVLARTMPQSEWADWMTEKLTELVAKLSIEETTTGDEIWNRVEKYFNENPINQQLQQDSISSIREEVPASADAFTIRWRSKYAG
jgi:hypothetical protein